MMDWQHFEPWIELNRAHLSHNLDQIRAHAGDLPVLACLDCNACGHGLTEIASLLWGLGVRHFGLSREVDVQRLQDCGIEGIAATIIRLDSGTLPRGYVPVGAGLLGVGTMGHLDLKPVISLKSRVLLTKMIPRGRAFGWNNEKSFENDTLLATIPVGYYDGYAPALLNRGEVLIHGRRFPIRGFISADHTTIDITGCGETVSGTGPKIEIGDEVVLLGSQGSETISAGEMGERSGWGLYGALSRFSPFLPRVITEAGPSPRNAASRTEALLEIIRDFGNETTVTEDADAESVKIPAAAGCGSDLEKTSAQAWIEVNREHLAWNVNEIRKPVGQRPILAVVKCNAYGHGLVQVTQTLQDSGIHHFAVVKVWEAVSLRQQGISGHILNLGAFSAPEAQALVEHDIAQSVFSPTVELLAREARKQGKRAGVHIKIDTGLGRVGLPLEEAPGFIRKVAAMAEIEIQGIFTVLTHTSRIPEQLDHFNSLCDELESEGISLGWRHAAASGDVADGPSGAYLDMVRPGNCLYGLTPMNNMDLRPVMALKSRVQAIHRGKNERGTVTVPVGTCDGYPDNGSGDLEVLIGGRRFPVKGVVSACWLRVDIGNDLSVREGDEVVLMGCQGEEEISNKELSQRSGQSVYRTPVYFNPFLPRISI